MRLNPLAFNTFLAAIGQRMSWRKAYVCPCVNQSSGSPKPNCPTCKGKGRTWITAVEGMAGISGTKVQREWAQFGQWESGDTVLTLPSDSALYAMGQFDRVTLLDGSEPFSLSLVRGNNDVLRQKNESIERVFWLSLAGVPVEGGIPTVGAEGALTWATGAPPAGTQYSITGRCRPEYFCFADLPSARAHHSGAALPRKVVLRKFDLLGR
jgi:hypothetical protein